MPSNNSIKLARRCYLLLAGGSVGGLLAPRLPRLGSLQHHLLDFSLVFLARMVFRSYCQGLEKSLLFKKERSYLYNSTHHVSFQAPTTVSGGISSVTLRIAQPFFPSALSQLWRQQSLLAYQAGASTQPLLLRFHVSTQAFCLGITIPIGIFLPIAVVLSTVSRDRRSGKSCTLLMTRIAHLRACRLSLDGTKLAGGPLS